MGESLKFEDQKEAQALVEAIEFFSKKGWSPATSTNYSIRLGTNHYLISRSGVDKSQFKLSDLIEIDHTGAVLSQSQGEGIKSSAETEIHTALYERFPEINCVLHTHSVLGTWLSQKNVQHTEIHFNGWEILKGIAGVQTHHTSLTLPVVYNHQEMKSILTEMDYHWAQNPAGFLIAGHGLYSWGKNVFEAKRHIETFEFLFELKKMEN
jgi:methylthioribulose-1-phosphate dehydratase